MQANMVHIHTICSENFNINQSIIEIAKRILTPLLVQFYTKELLLALDNVMVFWIMYHKTRLLFR